jgi:diguanylate cyclase (GGDEF)-like protein
MPMFSPMDAKPQTQPTGLTLTTSLAFAGVIVTSGGALAYQLQRWGNITATMATVLAVSFGVIAVIVCSVGFIARERQATDRVGVLLSDIDDAVLLVQDSVIVEALGPTEHVLGASAESITGLTLREVLQSSELDRINGALAHAVGWRDHASTVTSLPISHSGNIAEPDRFVDLYIRDRTADRTLRSFVVTVRDVTARARAESQLVTASAADSQTNLPNRSRFLELIDAEVHRARRSGDHITVLSVGIDRHATMIEGFTEADVTEIMMEMARRIRAAVRVEDAVGRAASDQFGVLLGGLAPAVGRAYAIDVADRIATGLSEPFYISGSKLEITVSIGAAHRSQGGTEMTPTELLRDAEESLRGVRANTNRWREATDSVSPRPAETAE